MSGPSACKFVNEHMKSQSYTDHCLASDPIKLIMSELAITDYYLNLSDHKPFFGSLYDS
jgi:hypothetical protein